MSPLIYGTKIHDFEQERGLMKKIILLLFMLIIAFTLNEAFATTVVINIMSVESTSIIPATIYPGDAVGIEVKIKHNGSTYPADNVIAILGLGKSFTEIDSVYEINKVFASQTISMVFKFKVKETAQAGKYTLPLKITYTRDNKEVIEEEIINLTVSEISKLAITEIVLSNTQPHIEETLTINAKVKNIGSQLARDVVVSLEKSGSATFGDFITMDSSKKEIDDLEIGEERDISFKIKPAKKITPGTYSFDLNTSCLDCTGTAKESISFEVLGKPELILSGIDFSVEGKDEKKIVQGDTFSLSVQLDNIGKEQAKAVEITIELNDNIHGSKKAYAGNIDEDDSGSGVFDFTVDLTTKVGEHTAIVKISYIDEVGKEQAFSEEYKIYVTEKPPADITGLIILLIILIVVAYFFVKMVFRQLAMRKI